MKTIYINYCIMYNNSDVVDLCNHEGSVSKFIRYIIDKKNEKNSFRVTNLSSVERQYKLWIRELPEVIPYYAVKCNPDPLIIRLLGNLGVNFDCATKGEFDLVNKYIEFDSERIIYANPVKMRNHLVDASELGIKYIVFDSVDELQKISSIPNHNFRLLLRISTDDKNSIIQFSNKFGVIPKQEEITRVLLEAKELRLEVVGVSFHVGSCCCDAISYKKAIEHSADIFQLVSKLELPLLSIVDIGGGFPGEMSIHTEKMCQFKEIASILRDSIQNFYTNPKLVECYSKQNYLIDKHVKFIAEPGRFFVSNAVTISTFVIGRKTILKEKSQSLYTSQSLYIDNGIYGSFNNIIYDHAKPVPRNTHKDEKHQRELFPTDVFGQTCDGLDHICHSNETMFPFCKEGDWLEWENMGAYTHTASFVFNGFQHFPSDYYCYNAAIKKNE